MKELDIRLAEVDGRGRYAAAMPDGSEAVLTYVVSGENHIIADRTFVPPLWRGQGVAERLVARFFADARAAGWTITPTCWFVADEFKRLSPAWDDLLKR